MQIEQQLQALNQDNIDSGNWRFASIACTLDYGLLLKLLLQFPWGSPSSFCRGRRCAVIL